MERVLATAQDQTNKSDNKMDVTQKDKDTDMKDENEQIANKKAHKNGESKKNGGLFHSSEEDDEDQVLETDEFGKLHRELCKKTKKDIEGERTQILSFLDELRADMVS